mgnify:CR=1 FL=1
MTLSERDIESLSSLLAALLVAEWKAQHSTNPMVNSPQRQWPLASENSESDAESIAYGPESQDHDPGSTPKPKAHGSLRLVSGSQKRRANRL